MFVEDENFLIYGIFLAIILRMNIIMGVEYSEEFAKTGRYKETAENKPIFDIKVR